ncbi:MAG: family 14 glycosylhydrolase [Halothece sp. Uz-M2-17]|nr:family 14 glycosylhydrolase [Halothece sp. Uz-M2-17]
MKALKRITSLILGFITAVTLSLGLREIASSSNVKDFNALAPLEIKNEQEWHDFRQQLAIAQKMGIDAIVTDIWWGKVEKEGDQQFNWSYYDRLLQEIETAHLHWIPILSFHQCGGNVGDNCDIPIPAWIWTHFPDIAPQTLQYVSEKGNASSEVVSLWSDQWVMSEYQEFMVAFLQRYGKRADIIDEIQISLGSAGELRYPAYNAHDDYEYPHRGYFQAYSQLAQVSFRNSVRDRYGNLSTINRKWHTNLTSYTQIRPPQQAEAFVQQQDYVKTQYGRDFIDWYRNLIQRQHNAN